MMQKRREILVLLLIGVVLICTVGARNATAVIRGGQHDLSMTGTTPFASDNVTTPCIFCHTPHGAATNQSYTTDPNSTGTSAAFPGLLWNRAIPAPVGGWTPYTSATLNANTSGGPGTLSLLCLSCHDGVGAFNVLIRNTSDGAPTIPGGVNQFGDFGLGDPSIAKYNIGGGQCTGDTCSGGNNLANDHPIGFSYNAYPAADAGIKAYIALPLILQQRLDMTSNRSLECSTCHDPHLDNVPGQNFLVLSNANSALCLACHNK